MPTINDTTVVASAYTTSASARPQRLSNGWIVTAEMEGNSNIRFQVSKDNGVTFNPLCSCLSSSLYGIAMSSYGTMIYCTFFGLSIKVYSLAFDAKLQANVDIYPTATILDNVSTAYNGMSIIVDSTGTELHATWSSKNATYYSAYNIRYAKGTISAVDGSVTWGNITQVTAETMSSLDSITPSITMDKNNSPVILVQYSGSSKIIHSYTKSGSTWTGHVVHNGGAYSQLNPSVIVSFDGTMHVVWSGADATYTYNIRYSKSTDNGVTWSAQLNLQLDALYVHYSPTITADNNNNLYVLWCGGGAGSSYYNIYKKICTSGVWGSITKLTTNTTNHAQFPTSLSDNKTTFSSPIFIYQNLQASKVSFNGAWVVTTISVTQGNLGTSYINEVQYTPNTWAEWTTSAGVVKDITGIEITCNGSSYYNIIRAVTLQANAKYGLLYNVVSSTLTSTLSTGVELGFLSLPKAIGNNKIVGTSNSVAPTSLLIGNGNPNEPNGNKIKLKDIRVFLLPIGSQIETDFNTLTADQLSLKYSIQPMGKNGIVTYVDNKSNLLTYTITTDGAMSTITEMVNGVTTYTVNGAISGQSNVSFVTQAQWDAIKYGRYKDATGGLNTLTISMGLDTWTYTFDKRLAITDDISSAMKAVQDSQSAMLPSVKAKLVAKVGGLTSDTFDSIISGINISSSNIKSIQRGSATVPYDAVNVTVSAVNSNNSILYTRLTSYNGNDSGLVCGEVINGTTLTFSRDGEGSGTATVDWELIEFTNVKSIQRGITYNVTTATISSVDMNKATTLESSSSRGRYGYASYPTAFKIHTYLTGATTLKLMYAGGNQPANDSFYHTWQVIEFI